MVTPVPGRISARRRPLGLAALLFAACGPASPGEAPPAAGEAPGSGGRPDVSWSFTDDRGVTVSLPRRPQRIVAQTNSAAALWAFGVRPVGIFGPQTLPDGRKSPLTGDVDLSAVRSVGQAYGELDLEVLAALRPELIVSTKYVAPTLWYIPDTIALQVEQIAPTVAISVVQRPVSVPFARFEALAAALGADVAAPPVVAARKRLEAATAAFTTAVAARPGLKVLVVAGSPQTLYVANPEVVTDLLEFRRLGLDLVQPQEPNGVWESLSWEQATRYPADLVLADNRANVLTPAQLNEIPTWRELPAVRAGQVGPWQAEARLTFDGFAGILDELAAVVGRSRTDVVP